MGENNERNDVSYMQDEESKDATPKANLSLSKNRSKVVTVVKRKVNKRKTTKSLFKSFANLDQNFNNQGIREDNMED